MPLDTDGQWVGAGKFNIPIPTLRDTAGHAFPDDRGLFVLHAVLLYTGKVLCFSGHVEDMNYAPLCYVFDPKNPSAAMSPIAFAAGADPFCCHYVQIPDGRILAVGGSQHDVGVVGTPGYHYRGSNGSQTIALFDPDTNAWTASKTGPKINNLQQGRWYPTAVVLPDGRVAVFSGRRELDSTGSWPVGVSNPGIADMVEILSPQDRSSKPLGWASKELSGAAKELPIYPGLHLAPNGRIYYTHTNWGQQIPEPDTASILIGNNANSATWEVHTGVGRMPPNPRREEGMSVLLPPAQDGKILVIGGSKALNSAGRGLLEPGGGGTGAFDHIENAVDPRAADILDTTTSPQPTWTSAGTMWFGRINGHCVILPDSTVLICGGHNNYKWLARPPASPGTDPSQIAEIYTPTGPGPRFRTVAEMKSDPRMYHSVALLLPDGRVFVAGGADANDTEPVPPYPAGWNDRQIGPGNVHNRKTYEFYEPPYFFKGPRPTIPANGILRNGTSTSRIEYGQVFTVQTPEAASISKVVIMRPGACTHHTDSEQRLVDLPTFTKGTGELTVTMINDAKLAPPGYYMLWIIDNQQRPCEEARFIQLSGRGTTCFIATAALGSADHPKVIYLQRLREEIRNSSQLGYRFIRVVNAVYGSFSPQIARRIASDNILRDTVRQLVVKPVVKLIGITDRITRLLRPTSLRYPILIASLMTEALLSVAILPLLVVVLTIVIGLKKRHDRPESVYSGD